MDHKCADPKLQLDVDLMILDYTLHQALEAVLAERQARGHVRELDLKSIADRHLSMVDSFLRVFRTNHPEENVPNELHFRLRLLKLATLFTRRLQRDHTTPSPTAVQELRQENRNRASQRTFGREGNTKSQSGSRVLFEQSQQLPLPPYDLRRNRMHVLKSLSCAPQSPQWESEFYGMDFSVSLLDILPSFFTVTAHLARLGSDFNVTPTWMALAAEFMMQAALEQFLIYGAKGSVEAEEAFAWGHNPDTSEAMDVDGADALNDDRLVNEMLRGPEDNAELAGWRGIRNEYLEILMPSDGEELVQHLELVAKAHPIATFETKILAYLDAVSKACEKPILIQLEHGQLEGLSKTETDAFKRKVGFSI